MIQYMCHNIRMTGAVLDTPPGRDTPNWRFDMSPQYTAKDVTRFWSKVDRSNGPDACWSWLSSTFASGYGQFKIEPRNHRTHRLAWEMTHGAIPDGLSVLHRCDNRRCCNPAHLWLGTHKENMADMQRKQRAASGDRNGSRSRPERLVRGDAHPARNTLGWSQGERNGGARLTVNQVYEIRARWVAGGVTLRMLSADYGVCRQTIFRAIHRKNWKHIGGGS